MFGSYKINEFVQKEKISKNIVDSRSKLVLRTRISVCRPILIGPFLSSWTIASSIPRGLEEIVPSLEQV